MPHASVIDGIEFARRSSKLSGSQPVSTLARVRENLLAAEGALRYEIEGLPQVQGRPALRVQVGGVLALRCQRCLGRLDFDLNSESLLLLYEAEAELAALPVDAEGPERIVARKEMPVLELLEDEVLLAVPYAPRHEECGPRAGDAPAATQRPLAGLRALMGGKR